MICIEDLLLFCRLVLQAANIVNDELIYIYLFSYIYIYLFIYFATAFRLIFTA